MVSGFVPTYPFKFTFTALADALHGIFQPIRMIHPSADRSARVNTLEPDDYRRRRHLSYQTPPSTRCHLSHANVTDSGSAVNGAGTPDRFLFYRCLCRSDHLGKWQSEALLASARLPSAEVFIRLLRLISAFMSASVVWIFIITHLLLFKQNVMSEFMVVVGYIFRSRPD